MISGRRGVNDENGNAGPGVGHVPRGKPATPLSPLRAVRNSSVQNGTGAQKAKPLALFPPSPSLLARIKKKAVNVKKPATFAPLPPLPMALQRYVTMLSSSSTSWGARKESFSAINRLLVAGKQPLDNAKNVTKLVHHLRVPMALQLASPHSLVVKSAGALLCTLVAKYPAVSSHLVAELIPKLLKTSVRPIKAFSIPGKDALQCVAKHVSLDLAVVQNVYTASRCEKLRRGCVEFFLAVVKSGWPRKSGESVEPPPGDVAVLMVCLPMAIADSSKAVGSSARKLFGKFAEVCEDAALQIFQNLTPKEKMTVLLENDDLGERFEVPKRPMSSRKGAGASGGSAGRKGRGSDKRRLALAFWKEARNSEEKSAAPSSGKSSAVRREKNLAQVAARNATRMLRSKRKLFRDEKAGEKTPQSGRKGLDRRRAQKPPPKRAAAQKPAAKGPGRAAILTTPEMEPSVPAESGHAGERSPAASMGTPSIVTTPTDASRGPNDPAVDAAAVPSSELFKTHKDEKRFEEECKQYFSPLPTAPSAVPAQPAANTVPTEEPKEAEALSNPLQIQLEKLQQRIEKLTETQDQAEMVMNHVEAQCDENRSKRKPPSPAPSKPEDAGLPVFEAGDTVSPTVEAGENSQRAVEVVEAEEKASAEAPVLPAVPRATTISKRVTRPSSVVKIILKSVFFAVALGLAAAASVWLAVPPFLRNAIATAAMNTEMFPAIGAVGAYDADARASPQERAESAGPSILSREDCFPVITSAADVDSGRSLCFNMATMSYVEVSYETEASAHVHVQGANRVPLLLSESAATVNLQEERTEQLSKFQATSATGHGHVSGYSPAVTVVNFDSGVDLASAGKSSAGRPSAGQPDASQPGGSSLNVSAALAFLGAVAFFHRAKLAKNPSMVLDDAAADPAQGDLDVGNVSPNASPMGRFNAVHVVKTSKGTKFTPVRRSRRIHRDKEGVSAKKKATPREFDFML